VEANAQCVGSMCSLPRYVAQLLLWVSFFNVIMRKSEMSGPLEKHGVLAEWVVSLSLARAQVFLYASATVSVAVVCTRWLSCTGMLPSFDDNFISLIVQDAL